MLRKLPAFLREYIKKLLAVLTAGLREYVRKLPAVFREYVKKLLDTQRILSFISYFHYVNLIM